MTKPRLPWKPTRDPLVFLKEVLPIGQIVKWIGDDKQVQAIGVTESFIDRKIRQFKKMRRVGVRVPLFKTHIEDPDNERGLVLDAIKAKNRRGEKSLFLKVKFHDRAAARRGTRVDVSAGMPPKFVDGRGNAYDYPIRHLALTSKPVVPGLDPWSDGSSGLVLSFNTPSGLLIPGDNKMKKSKIAQFSALMAALGVRSKGSMETQLAAAIKAAKKMNKNVDLSEDEEDELEDEDLEDDDLELGDEDFEDEDLEIEEAPKRGRRKTGVLLSESPVLVAQMKKTRLAQIRMLMSGDDALINPAYAKTLAKRYATPEAIKQDLNLSHGDGETEFDRVVATIEEVAQNQPLAKSGRHQTAELKLRKRPVVELSHGEDEDEDETDNVLIRNARALAKRHQRKNRRA